MKVNEIFEGIQGEGQFAGTPALFIRLSGCTRACDFCDTKYHIKGKRISIKKVAEKIKDTKMQIVVWTGGEPLLQLVDIKRIINWTKDKKHHLETNGDLIDGMMDMFDYVCVSPKEKKIAEKLKYHSGSFDIKVVTDLKLNKELISYATMLMPLTMSREELMHPLNGVQGIICNVDANLEEWNKSIRQDVWNYCLENNIIYCPRLHYEVWGKKRGK